MHVVVVCLRDTLALKLHNFYAGRTGNPSARLTRKIAAFKQAKRVERVGYPFCAKYASTDISDTGRYINRTIIALTTNTGSIPCPLLQLRIITNIQLDTQ